MSATSAERVPCAVHSVLVQQMIGVATACGLKYHAHMLRVNGVYLNQSVRILAMLCAALPLFKV